MGRRILLASDCPRFHTGYGTVVRALAGRWVQEHEVGVLGWYAPEAVPSRETEAWAFFPGGDWEAFRLAEVLNQFQPEILVTVGNLSMLASVPEGRTDWGGVWIGYFPIEGSPIPTFRLRLVEEMDRAVTFSRYAVTALHQAGYEGEVQCIPLGIDPDLFRPLPKRTELRTVWGLADRFVVGCVARNQPRKQLPILLRAFARFARTREDAFLYLHTDPDDLGWDLVELGQRYRISDRIGFTAELSAVFGVTNDELNEIFNLFDVFVLPSMAEGFGLPLLEAMAAGVPVVTTDYAAGAELVRGRGKLLRVAQWITGAEHCTDLALADEDHLVEILEHLYTHPEECHRLARAGRAYAEEWTWARCLAAWEELLDGLPGSVEARRRRLVEGLAIWGPEEAEEVHLATESALIALQERFPQAILTFHIPGQHHRLAQVCAAQAGLSLNLSTSPGVLSSQVQQIRLQGLPRDHRWKQWAAACQVPLRRQPRRLYLPVEEQAAALNFLRDQGWRPGDVLVGVLTATDHSPELSAQEPWLSLLHQRLPDRTIRLVGNGGEKAASLPEGAIDLTLAGDSLAQAAVLERCQILVAWEGKGSALGNALGIPLVVPTSYLPLPIPLSPALSEFAVLQAGESEQGLPFAIAEAAVRLLKGSGVHKATWRVDGKRIPPGQERLSIIVLTCNRTAEQLFSTKRCLDAVRKATIRPFEIIVVDNGSEEQTTAWLRQQTDLRVHYLPENEGVIKGRNLGASLARYEYLVFLDNDQYVRPGWDEELLRLLQDAVSLAGVEQWHCRPEGGVSPTWQRDYLTYVGAGGMIIERAVFEELGGFDPLFSPAYGEDPDLCWRAQERGYEFAWCRKAIIDHDGHLTLGRQTDQMAAHLRRLQSRWTFRFVVARGKEGKSPSQPTRKVAETRE